MAGDKPEDRAGQLPVRPLTTAEQRAAAITCAANATSPDDLRHLISVLALDGQPPRRPPEDPDHNLAAYKRGCRCAKCRAANVRAGHRSKYGPAYTTTT